MTTVYDCRGGKPGARETMLEVGAEGGSLAIIRERNTQGIWEYWALRDETTISDLLSEEKFEQDELLERSADVHSFKYVLSLLDQYPWFLLFPLEVHPDFAESILREVDKRGGKEAAENWLHNLQRRTRFD